MNCKPNPSSWEEPSPVLRQDHPANLFWSLKPVDSYTPLGLACLSQNFEVVDRLVREGADVNGLSECGSTPVLLACTQQDHTIVRYLVENGADVRKNNSYGDSCLIEWIKAVFLDWYMFSDRDLETIQLLLDHGADPFAKTCEGDDVLQFVCRNGCREIADYLMKVIDYSAERKADANELLGAMLSFAGSSLFRDHAAAVPLWTQAHNIRQNGDNYIQKQPNIPPQSAYGNIREFTSIAELEAIAFDDDAIRLQTLLICERILGTDDEETLAIIERYGKHYSSTNTQISLDLLMLALQRRIRKRTILHKDTCDTARWTVGLLLDLLNETELTSPQFEDVWAVFQLLTPSIIEAHQLLSEGRINQEQQEAFDRMVNFIPYLIYALLPLADSAQKRFSVISSVRELIRYDLRIETGETLLHLSLKQSEASVSDYWLSGSDSEQTFRNLDVVKLLVECGAHLDLPDKNNVRPSELLASKEQSNIRLGQYISLQCSAAGAIVAGGVAYAGLPSSLRIFVRAHGQQRQPT